MAKINFQSSQYVSVEFEIASTVQRVGAAVLDSLLIGIYYILIFAISEGNIFYYPILFLCLQLPVVFYSIIGDYFFNGRTLGKRISGIRVVKVNGDRIGLKESFARWVFKGDFFWINAESGAFGLWFACGLIGTIVSLISTKNQRVADMVANTIVISTKVKTIYNLSDVLKLRNTDTHEVKYPQVIRFTDEDMMFVKSVLMRISKKPSKPTIDLAREVCDEAARLMNIEPITSNRTEFLKTILTDYVVLTR